MKRIIQQNEGMVCKTNVKPACGIFVENTKLNHGKIIPLARTGWEDGDISPGGFDLILGND